MTPSTDGSGGKGTGKTYTAKFVREKETKNTVKFEEKPVSGQPPIIGSLYVQKFAVEGAETLEVTVTVK